MGSAEGPEGEYCLSCLTFRMQSAPELIQVLYSHDTLLWKMTFIAKRTHTVLNVRGLLG